MVSRGSLTAFDRQVRNVTSLACVPFDRLTHIAFIETKVLRFVRLGRWSLDRNAIKRRQSEPRAMSICQNFLEN